MRGCRLRLALGLAVMVVAVTVLLAKSHGDDPTRRAESYRASWSVAYGNPLVGGARRFRRDSRGLDISVDDGTCFPQAPASQTDPRRRLRRVRVRETPHRVIVSVVMRSEKLKEDNVCSGVGRSFLYRVQLPHPVGRRAVIAASDGPTPEATVLPASTRP